MPGWPSVGRADEQRLIEALRRSDADAPASLYDAYADRLSDYATSLLHDHAAAAEVVHDTIVAARSSVHRLKEPAKTRAWLYALVRSRCSARAAPAEPGGPAEIVDDGGDPELASLVSEALAELGGNEREALELAIRHELTTAEVGLVLGLTSRQAASHLAGGRDHLENSAAAVILARTGRAHCPDLSAMVDSWEGPLSEPLRKRLARHIRACEVCTEGRRRHVSAERLLDMIPIAYPPLSLRRRVIQSCAGHTTPTAVMEAGHFDRNGFPTPPRHRGTRRRARRAGGHRIATMVAAAACVVVATGAMVVATGQDVSRPDGSAQALVPPAGGPELITADIGAPTPSPSGASPSPRIGATTPTTTPAPTASRAAYRPSPTPVATRTHPRPRPGAAKLGVACPGKLGQAGAGVIQLSAANASVEWSATTSGGLSVTPAHGVLKAGARGRITVTADTGDSGSGLIRFRSNGGTSSCEVSWDGGGDPSASEAPPDVPDEIPSSTPSEAAPSGSPPSQSTSELASQSASELATAQPS